MTAGDWRQYDGGGEGLGNRLYQASRTGGTLEAVLAAAKTKRYPLARLRRMVLTAWLMLPEPPEERQARQLELRMNQYPAEKLRRMAADPQLTEEERSAAGRVLARRDS